MQTKRLHISGLTPAISENDLTSRFSVFGNVRAVYGVGQLNAVGQPRNFAFVSLEATPDKISKCLNVLSGSTWKGTKLRIGDARPDYEERLLSDRMEPIRPRKRRRLALGVESKDMGLVTLEDVEKHSGWIKTSLSHLVRPLRMRPLHPIPSALTQSSSSGRGKKRKAVPLTRARRRKIDPTLYGSVHMTESMLQADHVVIPQVPLSTESATEASPGGKAPPERRSINKKKRIVSEEPHDATSDVANPFEAEKQRGLGLLALLFDGKERWEGREDDLDGLEDLVKENSSVNPPKGIESDQETANQNPSNIVESGSPEASPAGEPTSSSPPPSTATARLKDLFAPQSAEPISILHGLDLDLEGEFSFSDMIDAEYMTEGQRGSGLPLSAEESRPQVRRTGLEQVQFSSTVPYFFPLEPHERSRGAIKDIIAVSATKGWMQPLLNPMTQEEARKQWESEKVALTRDWKQRHREASKKQRKGSAINNLE